MSTFALAVGWAILQSPTSPPLDLSTVLELSLRNSTEVRSAQANLSAARARTEAQVSRTRPSIGFRGTANRYDDKTILNFGNSSIQALDDHLEILELAIAQTIDVNGQVANGIAQARLNQLAAEFDVTTVTHAKVLESKVAYFNLLRANRAVSVAEANVASAKSQQTVIQQQIDAGVGQPIDRYRVATQLAEAERQLIRAQNARDIARSELNDRIGRPLEVRTLLVDQGSAEVTSEPTESREQVTAQSLDTRPEIKSATLVLRATERGIKIARASNEPTLSVGLAGNYYPTFSFQAPRTTTGTLSLMVSIPISDGGLASARVKEARAQVNVVRERLDQTRRNVRLEVDRAIYEVDNARRSLQAANVALQQAEAARKLAQSRYQNGVGLYLEITDTQAALVAAQNAQVNALYDLLVARAQLEYARGTDSPIRRAN